MANFDLYWNPANPYSADPQQHVEYKKRTDLSYTVAATLPNFKDHYTVTGLQDNTIYDFRISCDCGDTTNYSMVTSFISFTCPALTTNRSDNTMIYSFTPVNIDSYKVILYQDGVQFLDDLYNGPFFSDVSGSFTGLNGHSQYVIAVVMTEEDMSAMCNNGQVEVTCTILTDMNIS